MTMKTTGKLTLKDFFSPFKYIHAYGTNLLVRLLCNNLYQKYEGKLSIFQNFPDNGHNHKCPHNPCMYGYVHNHGWHGILHTWHCAKSTAYACDSKLDSDSYGFAYRTRGYSNYPNPENGLLTVCKLLLKFQKLYIQCF